MNLPTITPTLDGVRRWVPKRVLITAPAAERPHTAEIIRRCEAAGVTDIQALSGNRLTGLTGANERETYARAKSTLAVVVAPPSALKPQPIPPTRTGASTWPAAAPPTASTATSPAP